VNSVYCRVAKGKGRSAAVVNWGNLEAGEGSMGCTLGDAVGRLRDSKEVEASFNRDEEDSLGNLVGVHRLGGMEVDNNLITAIIEVAVMAPSVHFSHSFYTL
jgi:hypothetical protein